MSDRKHSLQKLAALAKFDLDPDEIPEKYSGKTTIDGESLSLEESLALNEDRPHCPECSGSGQARFGGPCSECHGWGVVPTEEELEEAAEAEILAREW